MRFLITGLFSKIPSPKKIGKDRFDHLWMLHLIPLTYPTLKLFLEHTGFEILAVAKDKEKKRMVWLSPVVWLIRLYCLFWPKEKREECHLDETLSPALIMGGNTLILAARRKADEDRLSQLPARSLGGTKIIAQHVKLLKERDMKQEF